MHEDENAYESLAAAVGGEERWAFGTGFDDPLAGIDRSVPDGVDRSQLAQQCLHLGDDALVLAQRLGQWCSNAPELEEEMALANIALDLLGQARMLLSRAAQVRPCLRPLTAPDHIPDEDALAFFRDVSAFRSCRLAALDSRFDFAVLIAQLAAMTAHRLQDLDEAAGSPDPVLAAVAAKGRIEAAYHWEYAAGWLARLGDGTEESRHRMALGLARVWPYLPAFDTSRLTAVIRAATLDAPEPVAAPPGEDELVPLLEEMQSLARAIPEATW